MPLSEVYPRVCGGTVTVVLASVSTTGLSPRVRGNPSRTAPSTISRGSIPACAGEPAVGSTGIAVGAVYPRVCGGTTTNPRRATVGRGLSPRVRGNQPRAAVRSIGIGSIPACAGEPSSMAHIMPYEEVYPRVCGGTTTNPRRATVGRGLSPRVRGNRCRARTGRPSRGSIPACAGEPVMLLIPPAAIMVYPRVCGGTHCLQ